MSFFDDFADGLEQEVLSEMADGFFGPRKRLDDMLEGLDFLLRQFRELEKWLGYRAELLHYLLMGRQRVRAFYEAIGIDPASIPFEFYCANKPSFPKLPWAFTSKGRYNKLVLSAYDDFQQAAEDYMHGRYYNDPNQKGRKRLTIHYNRIIKIIQGINEAVAKVNSEISPSSLLGYVKSFDAGMVEKEKVAGGMYQGDHCALDGDLCYRPVDLEALELKEMPSLPKLEEAAPRIKAYCSGLYAANKPQIAKLLSEIKASAFKKKN